MRDERQPGAAGMKQKPEVKEEAGWTGLVVRVLVVAMMCPLVVYILVNPQAQKEVVAGTISGAIGISVVYPLDTAKARLQTHSRGAYRGTLDVIVKMVQVRGGGERGRAGSGRSREGGDGL